MAIGLFFVESAFVEMNPLSDETLGNLIESESWVGKAGAYDLAGTMGQYAKLVEGNELTVLGFAPSAIRLIE